MRPLMATSAAKARYIDAQFLLYLLISIQNMPFKANCSPFGIAAAPEN